MVSLDDFRKLDLIVARITAAEAHPGADRLYVLKIDTGSGEKQLVAGIRASYAPEELVGRQIVVVSNLAPAVIRGVESQGMLLAASGPDGPRLLAPDREVPAGSQVK